MPKLARECLAGRCTTFSRKNAGDAFAYGARGFAAATLRKSGGEARYAEGWRGEGVGEAGVACAEAIPKVLPPPGSPPPPNAILPTVNRIQRKCSYVYTHIHIYRHIRARSFP